MAAVLAAGHGAVLSHRLRRPSTGGSGAARVDGIDVLVPGNRRGRERDSASTASRTLDPRDVTLHKGIPITTPARTLVDLAARPHALTSSPT